MPDRMNRILLSAYHIDRLRETNLPISGLFGKD